jgi:hypothetical protein
MKQSTDEWWKSGGRIVDRCRRAESRISKPANARMNPSLPSKLLARAG